MRRFPVVLSFGSQRSLQESRTTKLCECRFGDVTVVGRGRGRRHCSGGHAAHHDERLAKRAQPDSAAAEPRRVVYSGGAG
eukprot:3584066-Prymnesium_polylepis.2